MAYRFIARTEQIPAGTTRFFPLDDRSVVIANHAGEFFAVDGLCPHRGFELDNATLWDGRIECPWHRYQYDVRTGKNCFPETVYRTELPEAAEPIATYRVELRGAEIWVEIE